MSRSQHFPAGSSPHIRNMFHTFRAITVATAFVSMKQF